MLANLSAVKTSPISLSFILRRFGPAAAVSAIVLFLQLSFSSLVALNQGVPQWNSFMASKSTAMTSGVFYLCFGFWMFSFFVNSFETQTEIFRFKNTKNTLKLLRFLGNFGAMLYFGLGLFFVGSWKILPLAFQETGAVFAQYQNVQLFLFHSFGLLILWTLLSLNLAHMFQQWGILIGEKRQKRFVKVLMTFSLVAFTLHVLSMARLATWTTETPGVFVNTIHSIWEVVFG